MLTQADIDSRLQSPPKNKLKGLWHLLMGYRRHYVVAVGTLAFAASAKTATNYLIRYLVDDVIGDGLFGMLPWVAAGFIGLAMFEGSCSYFSGRLAAFTSERVAERLRNFLFDHLQRLSFTYHDHTQTGELIQRVTSDVDAVRRFLAQQAIGFGRILLLFLINLTAIATIHPRLALVSVVTVPVIVITSFFFFRRISTRYEEYQEQDGRVNTTLQENLSGVRVVKAFARQRYEIDKFETENYEKYVRGRRLLLMHTLFWPTTDIVVGAQMLFAYYTGARMAIDGTISVGSYLAFAGMVIWILWPIRNLGRLMVDMSRAAVSYGRLREIMEQKRVDLVSGVIQPEGPVRGEVTFDNVSFAYDGTDFVALKEISLTAEPGQTIALLGSTGSGKSSLISLLPRFYEPTSGEILLDGVPLHHYPRHYLRRQIGVVEQEPFLFSRTIRQNITYGVDRDVSNEEVAATAQAAAVHDVITTFPNGYQTLVGEKGVTLSGGQKQRVALARTLLKDPRILILDDATASVDTETEAQIREALQTLMPGRTTFIITHRAQTAMVADMILVLDQGRIVQRGRHEELVEEPGIYRDIYRVQAQVEEDLEAELARATGED